MAYLPRFTITPEILQLLEKIQVLHARITASSVKVRWMPSLQQDVLIRTAHGSSAIEGNPLTVQEAKRVLEGDSPARASRRSIQEIKNNIAVLRFIQKHSRVATLSEKLVHKVHALLGQNEALDRGPVGYYRSTGVRVGDHVAPAAADVPRLVRDLLEWINHEGRRWPAVVSSAVFHFRFEWIHPFGDGNGRVGRGLALWELYRRQFDAHHIFAVDEIIWENRPAYYATLARVQRDLAQDLTDWIRFMSRLTVQALERTWKRMASLQRSARGIAITLTPNQERLLDLLRGKPMPIAEIQKALKVTKPGAHHILKPLLAAGLVRREGGHKTGVYRLSG